MTSPEVGPLFGAVVFRYLDDIWLRAGRPDDFTVYDVGAGPGTLLRTVKVASSDASDADGQLRDWKLVSVDRVERAEAQRDRLPDDLAGSVVLANELLDNLAFRIVERSDAEPRQPTGAHRAGSPHAGTRVSGEPTASESPELGELREVAIDGVAGTEVLIDTDLTASGPLDIPLGTRAPVHQQARAWVEDVLVRGPLGLTLFDYGAPTTSELALRGGWLRTYRGHDRGHDPLDDPGRRDITTDIGWDQLPTPDRLETQAEFLRRWGIDDVVEEGRSYWQANAARPDLRAMRMRSRLTEVGALVDVDALGGWWVATWDGTEERHVADVR